MRKRRIETDQFDKAIDLLRRRFDSLDVVTHGADENLDASAEIPVQQGLRFHIGINLQNCDELHLNVGRLWVGWFPCGKSEVFDRFMDALIGLIEGRHRIVERFVGHKPVSASLEREAGDGWEAIARSSSLLALVPWPRRRRILRNTEWVG